MKNQHIVAVIVSVLFSISAYADSNQSTSLQALSAWTNQSGSTLYIDTIESNGLLTGTYINRAQGYGCQNISYPVTGWVYGTAITFNTLWQSTTESCNSITAWTGFYYQGAIRTLWQLTINGSTNTSQIIQGSDTFKPSTAVLKKSLILEK
ncbi:MAG: avidin/streptavidin family protein [Pseudomonadales bacterium]|nr:avidin/streptavidin family protein [Pseudomonadales bacterium]